MKIWRRRSEVAHSAILIDYSNNARNVLHTPSTVHPALKIMILAIAVRNCLVTSGKMRKLMHLEFQNTNFYRTKFIVSTKNKIWQVASSLKFTSSLAKCAKVWSFFFFFFAAEAKTTKYPK